MRISKSKAIECQAIRIRDLVSETVRLRRALDNFIRDIEATGGSNTERHRY